jgi:hypothetical protein
MQPSAKHMKSGLMQKIHGTMNKTHKSGLMQKHTCNHEQNTCNQDYTKTYTQPSTKQMQSGLMQKHTCNHQQNKCDQDYAETYTQPSTKHMQSALMQKHEYTQTRLWKTSCLLQTCSSENCQKMSTIPFKCLYQALEEDGFAQHSC